MTTIVTEVEIGVPPARVYDLITRPARWKEWHPSSLWAEPHAAESLRPGARFEEDVRSAGFRRRLRWAVEDAEPPVRWAARAQMGDGSLVHLLYELAPAPRGTRLRRTLSYALRPRLLRWLNDALLWRKVAAESRHALESLRRHLEVTR